MFCAKCGKENSDDDKFCCGCGAPLDDDVAAEQSAPAQQAPTEKVEVKGAKGKIVAIRDKVLGFEKKHSVIVNALVLACAVIILFVTLFAPIKVMAYEVGQVSDDASGESYHYVEIDQTIWDMFGAIGYIGLDSSNPDDAAKIAEIKQEYTNAMRFAITEDMVADGLSDMNYIAYVLAAKSGNGFSDLFMNGGGAPFMSLVFGLVVVVLSIVMAIISLVRIIYAIIGLVKKKTPKGLYQYLGTMFGLNVAALGLLAVSPMFKVGGGMFGIFVFIIILMLLLGSLGSLVMGKAGLAVVIKKSALTLVMLIAACLLCTNCIYVSGNIGRTVDVPYGYGFYEMMSSVTNPDRMFNYIGAFSLGILGIGLAVCGAKAVMSQVKSLACVVERKDNDKSAFGNSLGVVILTVIMVLDVFIGIPYGLKNLPFAISLDTYLNPQVYVAAVFFLAALIVMKAYKPENKPMFPAPEAEYVTVNGAPAEEAPAFEEPVVKSVEDVKEPEVDDAAPVGVSEDVQEHADETHADDLSGL